jgi:membrane protease YdiL (CAAX protease family)
MGTHIGNWTRRLGLPLWYKAALAPSIPFITIPVGLFVLHNAWIALLSYHFGMLAILYADRQRVQIKAIVKSRSYRFPLIMVLFGLAGGALLYVLWPFLNIPEGISQYMNSLGLSQNNWMFFFIYFVAVNPWLEEFYWRGYLGSSARRPVINDLLFASYHLIVLTGKMDIIWLPVVFLLLISGAWLWRQVNRWNGGLLSSVASHGAADFAVMLALFMLVFN